MELQEEARQRHATTVDSLTAELEEARDVARSTEQSASMVSATMGKAKLHGLIVDKAETKNESTITVVGKIGFDPG